MHRRRPDLRAVTVGFDDPRFDERPHALARRPARPRPRRGGPAPRARSATSSAWPSSATCRCTTPRPGRRCWSARRPARHVTVALTGDGGDEGFRRPPPLPLRPGRAAPSAGCPAAGSGLAALYPKADFLPRPLRLKRTLQDLGVEPAEAYYRSVSALLPDEVARLLAPRAGERRHPFTGLREAWARTRGPDHTSRVLELDLHTYLPGDILVKVDRCSMQSSLELRSPLLDPRILSFAAGLPTDWKVDGRRGKKVLKAAFEPWLGRELLERPKRGFSVPLAAWLRGPLRAARDEAIAGDFAAAFLDPAELRRQAAEHDAGRRDRAEALWAALMLDRWNRRWGRVA
ncbi:MAG: asparagine synthase-related protein [Planctomycetota bacterium]